MDCASEVGRHRRKRIQWAGRVFRNDAR
jgi:hypothetical protein